MIFVINTDGEARKQGKGSRLDTGVLPAVNDAGWGFILTLTL